ncbi:MAG: hypothetical protein Q7R81_05235 [Candidatus Peregrinibacteria bacterium]|nr:hypothetical protein [Candidatus Peregrinibacteria bacterium]
MRPLELSVPSCSDALAIEQWLVTDPALEPEQMLSQSKVRVHINGNAPEMLIQLMREHFPQWCLRLSDDDSYVDLVFRMPHRPSTEEEENGMSSSQLLPATKSIFQNLLEKNQDVMEWIEQSDCDRRIGKISAQTSSNQLGQYGELLLDVLIRKAIVELRDQLPVHTVFSPVLAGKKQRTTATTMFQPLLQHPFRIHFDNHCCKFYIRKEERAEYENAIISEGTDGKELLLLDVTTGSITHKKRARAFSVKNTFVKYPYKNNFSVLNVAIGDALQHSDPGEIVLPLRNTLRRLFNAGANSPSPASNPVDTNS